MADVEKGEFEVLLGGERVTFGTSLETLAEIESRAIAAKVIPEAGTFIDALNAALKGRATAVNAFVGALFAGAKLPPRAVPWRPVEFGEIFDGFMKATGLEMKPVAGGGDNRPLAEPNNGASGGSSPLAPST